jgi:hypothetical protein
VATAGPSGNWRLRRAGAGICWDTSDALTSTPNENVTYMAVSMISEGPSWTYTTVLNIAFRRRTARTRTQHRG